MGWRIFGKKESEALPVREKMSAEERKFREFGQWQRLLPSLVKVSFIFEDNKNELCSAEAKYLNNLFNEGQLPVDFPDMVLREFERTVRYINLMRQGSESIDFAHGIAVCRQGLKTLLGFNDEQVNEQLRKIMQSYFENQQFTQAYYLHLDHHVSLDEQSMSIIMNRAYEHFVAWGDFDEVKKIREFGLVDKIVQSNNRLILILRIFESLFNLQRDFESSVAYQKHEVFKNLMIQLEQLFAETVMDGYLDLRGLLLALIASRIDCLLVVENLDIAYQEKIAKEMWRQLALLHCQTLAQTKFKKGIQHIYEIERTVKQYEIAEDFRGWYRQQSGVLNPVLMYRL